MGGWHPCSEASKNFTSSHFRGAEDCDASGQTVGADLCLSGDKHTLPQGGEEVECARREHWFHERTSFLELGKKWMGSWATVGQIAPSKHGSTLQITWP